MLSPGYVPSFVQVFTVSLVKSVYYILLLGCFVYDLSILREYFTLACLLLDLVFPVDSRTGLSLVVSGPLLN